jgi:fructose-1,6-bisphosphatase/inositol monophosphatase family enzyme
MMELSKKQLESLRDVAKTAAREAGDYISAHSGDSFSIDIKEGASSRASEVVTEVDVASQKIIMKHLEPVAREYGFAILGEESEDDGQRLEKPCFWTIDPIDGTLSFIERRPGFSVSIALVSRDGIPLIGVVLDPSSGTLYEAIRSEGALRNGVPFKVTTIPGKQILSVSHDRSYLSYEKFDESIDALEGIASERGLEGIELIEHGGAVINALRAVEQGPACYFKLPRKGNGGGSIWDFAATACIAHEAGAAVSDMNGTPLDLNRSDSTYMNHRGALYASDTGLAREIISRMPLV